MEDPGEAESGQDQDTSTTTEDNETAEEQEAALEEAEVGSDSMDAEEDEDEDGEVAQLPREAERGGPVYAWPAAPSLGARQAPRKGVKVHTFPVQDYRYVRDGLLRAPSWTVYPLQLHRCLLAAAVFERKPKAFQFRESDEARELVRELTPNAFGKCLDDSNLRRWSADVHGNILLAVTGLIDLIVAKLRSLLVALRDTDEAATNDADVLREDLVPLLGALQRAFNPTSEFHEKNRTASLPESIRLLPDTYAIPLPAQAATSVAYEEDEDGNMVEVEDSSHSSFVHKWISYLLNHFGHREGFDIFVQAVKSPDGLSLRMLESLMRPLTRIAEFLEQDVTAQLQDGCRSVLRYALELLQDRTDTLNDKHRDANYHHLSQLLTHVGTLMTGLLSPADAEREVSVVQRELVCTMLGVPVFNMQLAAIREVNLVLDNTRLGAPSSGATGPAPPLTPQAHAAAAVAIEWLESEDLLKRVMRSNLHHKQYVDQVQRLMRFMLEHSCLQEEHLDLIWAITEKPDTFEAVRHNIFNLLADLSWHFSSEQLDSLFSKFEQSNGGRQADAAKILEVVRRLASGDQKGIMAQRLLDLLWRMHLSGEGPPEVLSALTEILGFYDANGHAKMSSFVRLCVDNVRASVNVASSIALLNEIVQLHPMPQPVGPQAPATETTLVNRVDFVQNVQRDYGLIQLLVQSIEMQAKAVKHIVAVNAGSEDEAALIQCTEEVQQRAQFLLTFIKSGNQPPGTFALEREEAQRLWRSFMDDPPDMLWVDRAFHWFWDMVGYGYISQISLEACISLLNDLVRFDPATLTHTGWQCLRAFLMQIGQQQLKIQFAQEDNLRMCVNDLNIMGMDYVWELYLSTQADNIFNEVQTLVFSLFQHLSENLRSKEPKIRESLLAGGVRRLCDAASALEKDAALEDAQVVAKLERRAERSLRFLHQFCITGNFERPAVTQLPPHRATLAGTPMYVDVTIAPRQQQQQQQQQQSQPLRIQLHSNEYVQELRAKVATSLQVAPGRVRMLYGGRELFCDGFMMYQSLIASGHVINATVTPADAPHPFSLVASDEAVTMLPRYILGKSADLYNVVFALASRPGTVGMAARELIGLLPTRRDVRDAVIEVLEAGASSTTGTESSASETSSQNSSSSATALQRLRELLNQDVALRIHVMEVIEALINPVNSLGDRETAIRYRQALVRLNPAREILGALDLASFPEEADAATLRPCFQVGLSLLRLVLLGGPRQVEPLQTNGSSASELGAETGRVLETAVGMLVDLTWRTARKGPDGPDSYDPSEDDLPTDDLVMCQDAISLLVSIFETTSLGSSLPAFLARPKTARFIVDMLFNCPDPAVRDCLAEACGKLCREDGAGSAQVRSQMLHILLQSRGETESSQFNCAQYFKLLCHVLTQGSLMQSELSLAETLLEQELAGLAVAQPVKDERDRRLDGRLLLIRTLIRRLGQRTVGLKGGGGLVKLLLTRFLFPEAAAPRESVKYIDAICTTRRARSAAFNLLVELVSHCTENLQEVVDLLAQMHYSEANSDDWEHPPASAHNARSGYVGLHNAGATCYMNSIIQQLYTQKHIRENVLAAPEVPEADREESVFYQLQLLFGTLHLSRLDHFTPRGFWGAFKDYDGMPVNLREHQDAIEFFNRLQDQIDSYQGVETSRVSGVDDGERETDLEEEEAKDQPKPKGAMERVMGGKFVNQIICRACPAHRSEREEDYSFVPVDVRNKRNLIESLTAYVSGELLEGDNQWHCEGCKTKVDAVKRACIKHLPHTLVIQLKRFEFDYETMQRLKLKDRFEFPLELDMRPYTAEGLSEADGASSVDAGEQHPPEYYQYELVGVVVHSGTAFAGHYYSIIRTGSDGQWSKFDDERVEPYDMAEISRDCFGGRYTMDVYDNVHQMQVVQEYYRPNSAYMLFYERRPMASESTAASAATSGVAAPGAESSIMPQSVYQEVMFRNKRYVYESHLMDKDHFNFMRHLVEANLDVCSRKLRRRGNAGGSPDGGSSGAADSGSGEWEEDAADGRDADQLSLLSIRIASEFLCKIYLQAHYSMRDDLNNWRQTFKSLLESNIGACRWFLAAISESEFVKRYLVRCPAEDVRSFFATTLSHALRCAVLYDDGAAASAAALKACGMSAPREAWGAAAEYAVEYASGSRHEQGSAAAVRNLVESMVQMLACASTPKHHAAHLLAVLGTYASIGAAQRAHLLQLNIISSLTNLVRKLYSMTLASRINDTEQGFTLLSLLIRGCFPQLNTPSAALLPEVLPPGAGIPERASMHPASRDMPKPYLNLTSEAKSSVYTKAFVEVLVDNGCHSDALIVLEWLAWENYIISFIALEECLDSLNRFDETASMTPVMSRLVLLEDYLQYFRMDMLMSGRKPGGAVRGVFDIIASQDQSVSHAKRYLLVAWIVDLVAEKRNPYASEAFDEHHEQFIQAVRLVEEYELGEITPTSPMEGLTEEDDDATKERVIALAHKLLREQQLREPAPRALMYR
mmetsp:Transcript_26886/g.88225  ORF Transcript_26886/g.88225 Transcript_26886/m.88225 type:complete len:2487 (+) Transcript_26886:54-7514(+)